MKLLLDTHIWLWSLLDPARLSRRVARILSRGETELWISPITTWEVLTLCEKGRLVLTPDPHSWMSSARARVPIRDAPITQEIALATSLIRLPHRDPADRLLAATARTLSLTLVTADDNLLQGTGFHTLPNR